MEVRRFAVNCLRELTDRQLVEYLPQLIQVLKFEPYNYSHLFEFLFLRSMRSIVLGHPFFWHLTVRLSRAPSSFPSLSLSASGCSLLMVGCYRRSCTTIATRRGSS
jgi:hypothetical protein